MTGERNPSSTMIVLQCGFIGLMCGLAESVLGLGWSWFGYQVNDPDLWVNWNSPWMAPLSMACWFAAFGVVVALLAMLMPKTSRLVAPFVVIAVGTWSALGAIPGLNEWAVLAVVAGVSYRLGMLSRLDSPSFLWLIRKSLPFAAAVWGAFFVATGVLPATAEWRANVITEKPSGGEPNVVLIVMDTVRADNLSHHGYNRDTSPRLAEWAKKGVTFSQARSTTPYTLGTHASLFTGHWMTETSARVNQPLDGTHPTLAETLSDRGYATGGFVGNIFYGSARYGLNRGFLHYHDVPGNITRRVTIREFLRSCRMGDTIVTWCERKWRILSPMQRKRLDADELNREALAWVDQVQASGRPFFLFMNYFDAHSPYTLPGIAPQPFSRVRPEVLEADTARLKTLQNRNSRRPDPFLGGMTNRLRSRVHSNLRDAYDDGIAWIDRKIDELLRELERRGELDNTLVIITADHGEMLGEHDLIGHGDSLHRQVVHVPLIVLGGRDLQIPEAMVIDRPVSVRDVPETIARRAFGATSGAPRFPGLSLDRFWSRGGAYTGDEPVFSEMEHLSWMPRTAQMPAAYGPMQLLTEGTWSYHRQHHEGEGWREHLFDLASDPGEEHDLAGDPQHEARLLGFRDQIAAIKAQASANRKPSSR